MTVKNVINTIDTLVGIFSKGAGGARSTHDLVTAHKNSNNNQGSSSTAEAVCIATAVGGGAVTHYIVNNLINHFSDTVCRSDTCTKTGALAGATLGVAGAYWAARTIYRRCKHKE